MLFRLQYDLSPLSAGEKAAFAVVSRLHEKGYESYIVGGAVRDRLLGLHPKEADVASNARPDELQALFAHTLVVGAAFAVVIVVQDGIQVEVATFRKEADYKDGRHPSRVRFSDVSHDALRRDFTINALFYDPEKKELLDFSTGISDLEKGILRTIGDPKRRFEEDYLRMLRAVRFSAHFGFEMDRNTVDTIRYCARYAGLISAERRFGELTEMLIGPAPDDAFRLLDRTGLMSIILPEIAAMKGVKQPPQFHPEGDVWIHTLGLLRLLRRPSSELAWAALLHDVGKPPTFRVDADGRERFSCHAPVGAKMAKKILRRLRSSNAFIKCVEAMVANHMRFADVQKMRESTLRRFLSRETFAMELELHRLDCLASHKNVDNYHFLVDQCLALQNEAVIPAPLINGNDLLERGIPEGPEIGRILTQAQELQLNGELEDRAAALNWLQQEQSE